MQEKVVIFRMVGKRPSIPVYGRFLPNPSHWEFKVSIYGRRSTAVPVKRPVRSPTFVPRVRHMVVLLWFCCCVKHQAEL